MDIYLPIAEISVNALLIILLGGVVGILSGMFGVGGGFLTTPLLIFSGISPAVAVASATTQITGASVSGVSAHAQRKGVDFRMGGVLIAGGVLGTIFGGILFLRLQQAGQIDVVVAMLYIILLTSIGALMIREAWTVIQARRTGIPIKPPVRRHHPLVAALPLRWRFYGSGLYISPLAPLGVGFVVGTLTVMLGIGGGFVLVPAMIYLLGMSTRVVVGTSLFQILFVAAATTMVHALTTQAVDIVLAILLLIGSVTGAQIGARLSTRINAEWLRLFLAALVIIVAVRMALGLGWRPDEIYSIEIT
ncbi:sulfite exporter TauE/SafE family protein [Parasphingopyxis algicola]|uniref:sulfite exporter TauE/SafE family protein n=1 Tax=Parasphingopyxis algicola TaxID=2026624 RepID=UPI0015A07FEB|nr:sulfite exporter TauE/SafE family protein [Parasphingopyxis algicola]QLC25768.1 sulfite exporter TauE/SafE family protein [Parasphingopyxis algicola]